MKFEQVHPAGWDAAEATSWRTGPSDPGDGPGNTARHAEHPSEYDADDTVDTASAADIEFSGVPGDGVGGTRGGEHHEHLEQDESAGHDGAHPDTQNDPRNDHENEVDEQAEAEAARQASLASLREGSARTLASVRSGLDTISDSMARIQQIAERERARRSPAHPTDSPPSNFSAARFTKGGND